MQKSNAITLSMKRESLQLLAMLGVNPEKEKEEEKKEERKEDKKEETAVEKENEEAIEVRQPLLFRSLRDRELIVYVGGVKLEGDWIRYCNKLLFFPLWL